MTTEAEFESSDLLGAPQAIAESPWVVMKFGGTSVSSADNWQVIASLVQHRLDAGLKPVIVHSALTGVSSALDMLLSAAVNGQAAEGLESIREKHCALAKELGVDGPALLDDAFQELEQLIAGVRLVREVSIRVRVRIMALGELMSTKLGAAYLQKAGLPLDWVDARDLLTSTSRNVAPRDRRTTSASMPASVKRGVRRDACPKQYF